MKLQVTNYSSPDVDNLWAWHPAVEDVYVLIEFQVEDSVEGGGDIFAVMVATPEALQRRRDSAFVLLQRGGIVVSEFAWAKLRTHIEQIVGKCCSSDWSSSVDCLRRHFIWEYENGT